MKKITVYLSTIVAAAFCLCGCGKTSLDVRTYLTDRGLSLCSVNAIPVDLGHNEKYWKVFDKKNGVNFKVAQDVRSSLVSATTVFQDNYDAQLVLKFEDKLPNHDGIDIVVEDEIWDETASFQFDYTNIEELEEKYKLIEECAKYLDNKKSGVKIRVSPRFVSDRMKLYKDNSIEAIAKYLDISNTTTYEEMKDGTTLDHLKKNYYFFGYKYHFSEIEDEIEAEYIDKFWDESSNTCIAVYRSGDASDQNNKDYDVYEDIYGDSYINFGNLYYLLQKEGFDVEGTIDDYTVTGIDGQNLHFSYNFVGDGEYGTYYLIDNEVTSCDANYFNLYRTTIKELFGLEIGPHK